MFNKILPRQWMTESNLGLGETNLNPYDKMFWIYFIIFLTSGAFLEYGSTLTNLCPLPGQDLHGSIRRVRVMPCFRTDSRKIEQHIQSPPKSLRSDDWLQSLVSFRLMLFFFNFSRLARRFHDLIFSWSFLLFSSSFFFCSSILEFLMILAQFEIFAWVTLDSLTMMINGESEKWGVWVNFILKLFKLIGII